MCVCMCMCMRMHMLGLGCACAAQASCACAQREDIFRVLVEEQILPAHVQPYLLDVQD